MSQIGGNCPICSTVCSGLQQRKYQRSALFVLCEGGIHPSAIGGYSRQWPVPAESVPCHYEVSNLMLACEVLRAQLHPQVSFTGPTRALTRRKWIDPDPMLT